MLKIRLKRMGRKKLPFYRVVVMESSQKRDGAAIAELGTYNPHTSPSTFDVDMEAVKTWLQNGAQPTETVMRYLVKAGVMEAPKYGSTAPAKKAKKKASEE